MKRKGSYTVEATWIVSITIFVVFLTISISFQLYERGLAYLMQQCQVKEMDTVTIFREISFGKDILKQWVQ